MYQSIIRNKEKSEGGTTRITWCLEGREKKSRQRIISDRIKLVGIIILYCEAIDIPA